MRIVSFLLTGTLCLGSLTTAATAEEPHSQYAASIVLGNLLPEEGGAPAATPSPLKSPFGVDFDPQGRMFIVELEGGRVHRLDPDGRLAHISGDGSKTYRGDGGPARDATYNGMHNVAITPDGHVFIADSWNHCIRKIDAHTGIITTFAGTGEKGFSGDGGPADKATFDFVMCITLDPSNRTMHVADLNNRRIRAIDMQSKIVTSIAGNGKKGVPDDGALAAESPLVDPRAVAADAHGNVYVLERGGHALRRVDKSGRIHTVAGTGIRGFRDGPAREAQFNSPKHVCLDDQGRVLIADDVNEAIRRYDPRSQTVVTLLGRGFGRPPLKLKHPHGVCVEQGVIYVVDPGTDRVLKLSPREKHDAGSAR